MNPEALGGNETNSGYARLDSAKKYENKENRKDFHELRIGFAEYAMRKSFEDEKLMTRLRGCDKFQWIIASGDFDNNDEARAVVVQEGLESYLSDVHNLEDAKQQEAFIAMLARVEKFKEDSLRQKAVLENQGETLH